MGLFETGEGVTPPLNQISDDDFSDLRGGRAREDVRIEAFFARLEATFWSQSFAYTNNQGTDYSETIHVACRHLFHQTYHRGQVHAMLSQTSVGRQHSTFTASSIPEGTPIGLRAAL